MIPDATFVSLDQLVLHLVQLAVAVCIFIRLLRGVPLSGSDSLKLDCLHKTLCPCPGKKQGEAELPTVAPSDPGASASETTTTTPGK